MTIRSEDTRMTASVRPIITEVRFDNFKGLGEYRIGLRHMNVLVGPNNSGKSTVVGAFRVLAAGIRSARSRGPERLTIGDRARVGWRLSETTLPISIENVHTAYNDVESTVVFRLSNANVLRLIFPPGVQECYLIPEASNRAVTSAATFKTAFPLTLGIVPVLGPVEHDEDLVEPETVRSYLTTHRASRHFRSYWYHFPEDFQIFRAKVRETWPGMDIQPSQLADPLSRKMMMLALEDGFPHELYWSGAGFQVWCQVLTHLIRAEDTDLVVIDEPEIYLHPDVQRQLLGILRDLGPDIVLATHSSEILSECERDEVLIVDKTRQSAERVSSASGIRAALQYLGSTQNVVLSRLARTRRVIFVEGDDFKYLARLARKLGHSQLAAQSGVTVAALGHFPATPNEVLDLLRGMEEALGQQVVATCLFDRDYRTPQEVRGFEASLAKRLTFPRLTQKKELENYLLVPRAIDAAVQRAVLDQSRRSNSSVLGHPEQAAQLLTRLTQTHWHDVQAQYVAHRIREEKKTGRDEATITASVTRELEEKWSDLDERLNIIPGKAVVGELIKEYQVAHSVNITPLEIIEQLRPRDIASDLKATLRDWDSFKSMAVGVEA